MGCISSKVIARSISYHEERKQGSRRTSNGIPLLEDLIISAKLHSRSFGSNSSPKSAIEPVNLETTDNLEAPTSLSQEVRKQIESDKTKKSKSWHEYPDHILASLDHENSSGFEDKHNHLSSKKDVGSRSFHTVEEYEDMLNRICLPNSALESEFDNEDRDTDDKDSASKSSSDKESEIVKKISIQNTEPERNIVKSNMLEKGIKRKTLAKRLESLRIPPDIELPAIGSLKEWIPEKGIYSPETYVTPKFGSYSSLMNIRNENESSEDSVFSSELVSVFEEYMKKFEADEENFLKQITEDEEEENDEEMQPQERTQPSIQG